MKKILLVLSVIFPALIMAQGSLLIIGGGSESDEAGSWSTEPYSWAVAQSANKRVAIISYSTASDWMRNYFVDHCGAASAKDFKINSKAIADNQETYDSLMTYDVIFLKGGDQWNYYSTYKNTRTQEAIRDKYNEGGVICGTSAGLAVLSKVIFTAQRGTVYPDECIEDPNNQYVTLADDFFNFFPGYIFDSHFTERGRAGRLMGFLANWKLNYEGIITGIGIDETTAMAISKDKVGQIFGTGAANIYQVISENPFHLDGEMLNVDSLKVSQLLDGSTIDFNTGVINGFEDEFTPELFEEKGNYTIYASGGDDINDNVAMLDSFLHESGSVDEKILIVTGSDETAALASRNKLVQLGATDVQVFSGISSMGDDPDFEKTIQEAKRYLFINNVFYILENFLQNTANGALLYDHIRRDGKIIGFVGDNSRFAGKTIIENYMLYNAAGTGSLVFKEGFGLLKTSVIMPNSFFDSDMYMNPAAGIPYAMLQNQLRFGIWLTRKNYIKYAPGEDGTFITTYGSAPSMILELAQTKGGFATRTYSDAYNTPKMIAGFEQMKIRVMSGAMQLKAGSGISAYSVPDIKKSWGADINVYPNPVSEILTIENDQHTRYVSLISLTGETLWKSELKDDNNQVNLSRFSSGFYMLRFENIKGQAHSETIVIR